MLAKLREEWKWARVCAWLLLVRLLGAHRQSVKLWKITYVLIPAAQLLGVMDAVPWHIHRADRDPRDTCPLCMRMSDDEYRDFQQRSYKLRVNLGPERDTPIHPSL